MPRKKTAAKEMPREKKATKWRPITLRHQGMHEGGSCLTDHALFTNMVDFLDTSSLSALRKTSRALRSCVDPPFVLANTLDFLDTTSLSALRQTSRALRLCVAPRYVGQRTLQEDLPRYESSGMRLGGGFQKMSIKQGWEKDLRTCDDAIATVVEICPFTRDYCREEGVLERLRTHSRSSGSRGDDQCDVEFRFEDTLTLETATVEARTMFQLFYKEQRHRGPRDNLETSWKVAGRLLDAAKEPTIRFACCRSHCWYFGNPNSCGPSTESYEKKELTLQFLTEDDEKVELSIWQSAY